MKHDDNRSLAKRIAERLFTDGTGERADRLVLQASGRPHEQQSRNLGSYSFTGAAGQILAELEGETSHAELAPARKPARRAPRARAGSLKLSPKSAARHAAARAAAAARKGGQQR